MHFVYILESESTGNLYIGQSAEPDKRLNDHNRGASPYTKNKGSWKRIHLCQFETLSEAILLEKKLKSWKSPKRVKTWIEKGFNAVG